MRGGDGPYGPEETRAPPAGDPAGESPAGIRWDPVENSGTVRAAAAGRMGP